MHTYVVYTYYDNEFNALYVGCSDDFYDKRFIDMYRFGDDLTDLIKYTGFIFFEDKKSMLEAKKHWIKKKKPKWNKRKYETLSFNESIAINNSYYDGDELVVVDKKLLAYWDWHNSGDSKKEDWEDPFYSKEHMEELERRVADVRAGRNMHEHELIEVD